MMNKPSDLLCAVDLDNPKCEWRDLVIDTITYWPWAHFSRNEMACKCGCDQCEMKPEFMDRIDALRDTVGFPALATSGYRCPYHDGVVGGAKGLHSKGIAVDLQAHGSKAREIIKVALNLNFPGIGVSQHNVDYTKRFIHLDDDFNRPGRFWSYPK